MYLSLLYETWNEFFFKGQKDDWNPVILEFRKETIHL